MLVYADAAASAYANVLAKLLPSCTTCSHIHSDLLCLSTQSKMFVSLHLLPQARSNFLPPVPCSANASREVKRSFFLGRWISPKKKTKTGVFLLADSTLRTSNEFVYLGLCPDHGYPAITSWQNSLIPFCRSVEALFPYLRCGD